MRRSHMLQSASEIKSRARKEKKRKLAQRGQKVGYGEDIEDDSDKWELVSLLAWPKEERFALYRSVKANFKEECVNKPHKQKQEHDKEKYDRKVAACEKAKRLLFKGAVKQALWFKRERAISTASLNKMLKGATHAQMVRVLRDQVNIRRYVDDITDPISKRVGGWLSGKLSPELVIELRGHVGKMVKEEKFTTPPSIVPALQSESTPAYLSKFASQLSVEREAELVKLRMQLDKCLADGSFKALISSNKAPKALKAKKRRQGQKSKEPTVAEQAALSGSVFNDDGITWTVLKVQWDDALDSIIVFYYDSDSAQRELIDEDSLHEDHEYVEHSSLEEVLSWIAS